MSEFTGPPLEQQIAQWRMYLGRQRGLHAPDVEELETHLREQLSALMAAGLSAEEAFLVAVKRIGSLDALSREFARAHSDRLWKQLVLGPQGASEPAAAGRGEVVIVLGLAIAAALALKLPALFGLGMDGHQPFYFRNASLFTLPLLAVYFLWKRGSKPAGDLWLALAFATGAVFANLFPFRANSETGNLTAVHLPIALWLAVGFAYAGNRWFEGERRMNFVRFSGELAIYYALIAFGGGALTGLALMLFNAIGINAQAFAGNWLVPCGAAGAVIIASWLVEAKQSVIENMAPVLTRLFTPLFTLLLLLFLATMAWTGSPIQVERQVLIGFDLLLAVVVGLVLYAVSARDPNAPPDLFDGLQLLLVLCALVADGCALAAMGARISAFGFTPNRVAALGENLVLLVNLAGTAWFYLRCMRRRGSFAKLEGWQVAYLPVYAAWAAVVIVVFPPLFGYR